MTDSTMTDSTERGFTLLEVLVALVILAAGLAAFYQTFGTGLMAEAAAEQDRRTTEAAQNLLAELSGARVLQDGVTSGERPDGLRWTLKLDPFVPFVADDHPLPIAGHLATLEVTPAGRRGRSVRLQTLVLRTVEQ